MVKDQKYKKKENIKVHLYAQLNSIKKIIIIIIISLLISPLLGHGPSLWIAHKKNGP
jgi:hypothetical protein